MINRFPHLGETDGSSYPNGGLRATHAAGGYLAVDPTSPIFLRGDTIFIPSCLVSYYGHALDEKTPLLRATDALSREGARLLNLLGYKGGVEGLTVNIGLEQVLYYLTWDTNYTYCTICITHANTQTKQHIRTLTTLNTYCVHIPIHYMHVLMLYIHYTYVL